MLILSVVVLKNSVMNLIQKMYLSFRLLCLIFDFPK
jgi:hypothetical protein